MYLRQPFCDFETALYLVNIIEKSWRHTYLPAAHPDFDIRGAECWRGRRQLTCIRKLNVTMEDRFSGGLRTSYSPASQALHRGVAPAQPCVPQICAMPTLSKR